MLGERGLQKGDASLQLVEAIDTVLDADPTVESDGGEFRKDRIVVVQVFADFTVLKTLSVALHVYLFMPQVIPSARVNSR